MGEGQDKQNIESLLRQGHSVQFPPTGWSMYPLIVNGRDQVIVEPADPEKLRRGAVALYRRRDSILVLHRVWKRTAEGFYMVGDNQVEVEGPLAPEQIRGVMTAVVRKGKTIPVTSPLYRFLTGAWLVLRPVRMVIMRPLAALKRAVKGLLGAN